MNAKLVSLAFLLLMSGRQVAFLDLSVPPRTLEPSSHGGCGFGGGVLYHGNAPHPLPGTPPVSLKLTRVITAKDGPFIKDTVEVVVTNIGKTAISVPIGDDPVPLLAPTEKDRSYLEFKVTLAGRKYPVALAKLASNSEHPESSAVLQPDDTVVLWLPGGKWDPKFQREAGTSPEVSVSVTLMRKAVINGADCDGTIGEEVHSQNSLPLPNAAGVETVR